MRAGQSHIGRVRGRQDRQHPLPGTGRSPHRDVPGRTDRQGGVTVRRLAASVAALLLAGAVTACGSESWEKKCTTSTAGVITCRPDQRPPARDVTGDLLSGGTYDVAADRGKVVVVNFWGSWCPPCRAEAAGLQKTYVATRTGGVTFVGVNSRDDRDA